MALLDFQHLCVLEMTGFRAILLGLALLSCNQQEVTEVPEELPNSAIFEEARIDPRRCSYEDCVYSVRIPAYRPRYVNGTTRS